MWPDVEHGTWCCSPWCYVNPKTCTLADVQPSTISGTGKDLFYSYKACSGKTAPKYTSSTCPWKEELSFEAAAAAVLIAEKIGNLRSHDDSGVAHLEVIQTATNELAISAGNDKKICVFDLRKLGGRMTFCTPVMERPKQCIAAAPGWIATSEDGSPSVNFWNVNDDADPSLTYVGHKDGPAEVRFLKYLPDFGLFSSTEDGFVSVWDVQGNAALPQNVSSIQTKGQLGPFTWPPGAIATVTFAAGIGVAINDFANVNIWSNSGSTWTNIAKLSGHSRLVTSLAFHSGLGLLASGSLDSNVALWKFVKGTWTLATYLYDHKSQVQTVNWIPQGPFLASGDAESLIFWRPTSESTCDFEYISGYYLAGFNRYVIERTSVDNCRALCCQNAWCLSFDFAYDRDPDGSHGPNTCWMSTAAEGRGGGAGLVWAPGKGKYPRYDYYELKKRGTRFMTLEEPKGIKTMRLAKDSKLLLTTNNEDGLVNVWKLGSSYCPDGQMPSGDGVNCVLCPIGRAGTAGICPACRPGSIATSEGLTSCTNCPAGKYNPAVGGQTCFFCRKGTYSEQPGSDICTNCGRGYASSVLGSNSRSNCKHCYPGEFNDQEVAEACTKCPGGQSHDNYASVTGNDCTDCRLCGTEYQTGSCPIPKDTQCNNCPGGQTVVNGTSCSWCPLNSFPHAEGTSCQSFGNGDFNAVQDTGSRKCYTRQDYKDLKCPTQESGGYGSDDELNPTDGKPKDTPTTKYSELSTRELDACSKLHCMGAVFEQAVIASRMYADPCRTDDSLLQLCTQSQFILNKQIDDRERLNREREESHEFRLRTELCEKECDCHKLCRDATDNEQDKEKAFKVAPFALQSCEVRGLVCTATCTSTRPPKTVYPSQNCLDIRAKVGLHYPVRDIVIARTTLPRCHASCSTCPQKDTPWHQESFETCNCFVTFWEGCGQISMGVIIFGILLPIFLCCCGVGTYLVRRKLSQRRQERHAAGNKVEVGEEY
eukprot:gnl/MRDRNA2_/MRDRNA2_86428_c0_seq1.p1 gnl/MRDRNA2_/MRDRNA2_86428_c0~~gnl/MRDRNA2_/MRDRNA2_86428_c0_seq1.p1  ORF type:complete len:1016 (+),score=124.05 gnl/MRDRNA2_/MRDRNA2_86428_c0_seq1:87-3050(+)